MIDWALDTISKELMWALGGRTDLHQGHNNTMPPRPLIDRTMSAFAVAIGG
jgi:hypothetical protein